MTFRIVALDAALFAPLVHLSDAELASRNIVRRVCTAFPGSPCRVSLADAEVGETLLLLNFEHLAVASPYRSTHAIFVREGVAAATLAPGEVPLIITRRLISMRGFDAAGMMTGADVVPGSEVAGLLDRMFADSATVHVDLHNARPGCFAARAIRDAAPAQG